MKESKDVIKSLKTFAKTHRGPKEVKAVKKNKKFIEFIDSRNVIVSVPYSRITALEYKVDGSELIINVGDCEWYSITDSEVISKVYLKIKSKLR